MGYSKKTDGIKLNHNEVLSITNKDTGEIREIGNRPNNIPKGKELFGDHAFFTKTYPNSWIFLKRYCSHLEISAIVGLVNYAKNGNSLEPITDAMKPHLYTTFVFAFKRLKNRLKLIFRALVLFLSFQGFNGQINRVKRGCCYIVLLSRYE